MSKKELTIIKLEKNKYFIRIPEERDFIESLREVHKKTGAKFAHVTHSLGGGFKDIRMYHSKLNPEILTFPGPAELLNAQVNFTQDDESIFVHCHATLSHDNKELSAFGGHLLSAKVAITTEMVIETSDVDVRRSKREDGLPLVLTSKGGAERSSNKASSNKELFTIVSFVLIVVWLSVITYLFVKKSQS